MIANTRQVFHTAATYKHHGVLLKLVTFTRDIGCDLNSVG
jgi:hypothetical protein